jgi:2-iminoacetate synthase
MTFAAVLAALDGSAPRERQRTATTSEVESLLGQERIDDADLALLFAEAADDLLEPMARRASTITAHRFGKVIQLYAPLYLSDECVNDCAYCGFALSNPIPRRTLTVDEAIAEADVLYRQGFRHLLLVSGEAKHAFSAGDLETVARELAGRFASLSIEVFPMDESDYVRLERAGIDGLTLYQETYNRERYRLLHRGPKAEFDRRLAAIEAGGQAGFRTLGIGVLLGLHDWRDEAPALALHARYLARRFWRSRIALSFPRLRPAEGGFQPPHPVTDHDLAHLIVAMRLAMPDAEIVISTRERAELRDRLIPLGVTRMSAGSKTNVGGYHGQTTAGDQFAVHDDRPPAEVARAIAAAGWEPVWKDFDEALRSTSSNT